MCTRSVSLESSNRGPPFPAYMFTDWVQVAPTALTLHHSRLCRGDLKDAREFYCAPMLMRRSLHRGWLQGEASATPTPRWCVKKGRWGCGAMGPTASIFRKQREMMLVPGWVDSGSQPMRWCV